MQSPTELVKLKEYPEGIIVAEKHFKNATNKKTNTKRLFASSQ